MIFPSFPAFERSLFSAIVSLTIIGICCALCPGQDPKSPATANASQPPPEPSSSPDFISTETSSGATAPADEERKPLLSPKNIRPFSPYSEAIEYYLRSEKQDSRLTLQIPPIPSLFAIAPQAQKERTRAESFNWEGAIKQSFLFLSVQHSLRLAFEPDTRAALKGDFWKDYIKTISSLRGWNDGDSFATNYVGHPMMGAISGFIQIHNDPRGAGLEFDSGGQYRQSRLKALAWSAAYSLQFEVGLFSESSIGNVGLTPRKASRHPMAFVDLVVTPIIGTGWVIGEDALDRYVIARIEQRTSNHITRVLVRSWLNPSRSLANLLRFKKPWRRDTRQM